MMRFFGTKKNVAAFVEDITVHLKIDSQSITIMSQGKYAACSVPTAIGTSLGGIVKDTALAYSLTLLSI